MARPSAVVASAVQGAEGGARGELAEVGRGDCVEVEPRLGSHLREVPEDVAEALLEPLAPLRRQRAAPVAQSLLDDLRDLAGLDTDFRRLPFGPLPLLLARAESVTKLQAVCHGCGGEAVYTQRRVGGRPAPFSGETVLIGALDAYEARCRQCYQPGHTGEVAALRLA